MERLRAAGRALARRHQGTPDEPVTPTMVDYAELPRTDDWSLRSALVRVAQRDPVLAGVVLEAVRRCDAALAPHRRALEAHGTTTDRGLSGAGGSGDDEPLPPDPVDPAPDSRAVDLARLVAAASAGPADGNGGDDSVTGDDGGGSDGVTGAERGDGGAASRLAAASEEVVTGYQELTALDPGEVAAVPLLVAALRLDRLAEVATEWAVTTADPLPAAELDRLRRAAWSALDAAGAPREEGRPPPGVRSRRG